MCIVRWKKKIYFYAMYSSKKSLKQNHTFVVLFAGLCLHLVALRQKKAKRKRWQKQIKHRRAHLQPAIISRWWQDMRSKKKKSKAAQKEKTERFACENASTYRQSSCIRHTLVLCGDTQKSSQHKANVGLRVHTTTCCPERPWLTSPQQMGMWAQNHKYKDDQDRRLDTWTWNLL